MLPSPTIQPPSSTPLSQQRVFNGHNFSHSSYKTLTILRNPGLSVYQRSQTVDRISAMGPRLTPTPHHFILLRSSRSSSSCGQGPLPHPKAGSARSAVCATLALRDSVQFLSFPVQCPIPSHPILHHVSPAIDDWHVLSRFVSSLLVLPLLATATQIRSPARTRVSIPFLQIHLVPPRW